MERSARSTLLIYFTVSMFALFAAFPFIWAIITMFKTDRDLYDARSNPFIYNEPPTTGEIEYLLESTNYLVFVGNSLLVGVCVVLLTLAFGIPAAYSLARLSGRWGERLGILIFCVYLVPPTLLFLPLSRMVATLGLQDRIWSLVLVYPTFTIPFCTWLLMGFFKAIPKDIEEQAMVDGYSRFGAMIRIVLPLAVPGILTVVVFAFTLTMHEFIYALAFVSPSSQKTISVGVPTELVRGDVFYWQSLMAAAVIVALPIALLYNLFLNRFISGFTLGAVKG